MPETTQQDHLKILLNTLEPLMHHINDVLLNADVHFSEKEKINQSLAVIAKSADGIDLRRLNTELVHRIVEGSDNAISALAGKNMALSNRAAANSVDGCLIPHAVADAFMESTSFIQIGESSRQDALTTHLDILTKLFKNFDPHENQHMRDLISKAST